MENNFPIKIEKIDVDGWLPNPLEIEYTISNKGMGSTMQLEWGIKGNNHRYNIVLQHLYREWDGDYNSYFKSVLTMFREDFLKWYELGFPQEWMQNYYKNYYKHIIY